MTRLRPLAALLGLAAVLALVAVLGRYEVVPVGTVFVARLDRWTGQTLLVDAPGALPPSDRSALNNAAIDALSAAAIDEVRALFAPADLRALSDADVRKLLKE